MWVDESLLVDPRVVYGPTVFMAQHLTVLELAVFLAQRLTPLELAVFLAQRLTPLERRCFWPNG